MPKIGFTCSCTILFTAALVVWMAWRGAAVRPLAHITCRIEERILRHDPVDQADAFGFRSKQELAEACHY